MYINDSELLYEIIISKGKGKLTKRAQFLLIQLGENILPKLVRNLYGNSDNVDLIYDIKMNGITKLLTYWKTFNHYKYDKCIPYYTEIFKRGAAEGYNIIVFQHYRSDFGKIMIRFNDNITY